MEQDYLVKFLYLVQNLISKEVKFEKVEKVNEMCGVDVAYQGEIGVAAAVCNGRERRENVVIGKVSFPYVPGLLFMREAPIMIKALENLDYDLLLVDGHGIAHPRRSGIATVIGVLLNKPTIGVAKSRLIGEEVVEGGITYIVDKGEKLGVKVGKYYYSPGNLVTLQDVLNLSEGGYPSVLREADKLSKKYKKEVNQ
ncbi:MAG: endonuclease V [Metallosphaera sp.]